MTTEERLWVKVKKSEDGGCWEWTSAVSGQAEVPMFNLGTRTVSARRFIWEMVRKSKPPKRIEFTCGNHRCVNPDHSRSRTVEERFHGLVNKTQTCWLWLGTGVKGGYGQFSFRGRSRLAHRCSYEIHVGKVPEGMDVLHKCDVPACVNPDHLFLGTDADNSKDMIDKGRSSHGENHHRAKLTEDLVREIRRSRLDALSLAVHYGVTRSSIYYIRNRKSWRHI